MKRNFPIYRQAFKLLRQYPAALAAIVVASFFSVLSEGLGLGLILPLLQPSLATDFAAGFLERIPLLIHVADWLPTLPLIERIRIAALLLIVVILIKNAMVVAVRYAALNLQQRIEYDLKSQTFRQLHEVELRYIYGQQVGGLLTTLNQYTWQSTWMMQYVTGAIADIFALVIYAALMLLLSWQLTLMATVLMGTILVMNNWLFLGRLRQHGLGERDEQKRNRTQSLESLSAMKLLHLFRKEEMSLARFDNSLRTYQDFLYDGKRLTALLMPIFSFLSVLLLCMLLLLGTFLMPEQIEAWLARLGLFLVIIFRLMGPASKLNHVNGQVSKYAPAFQSVMDFLNQSDKPYLPDGSVSFAQLNEEIRLQNVTFRYGTNEANVVTDISFPIPKGKMTALVGPSGAGKSTIVDLVARLHDCDSGTISVDGLNVRELTLTSWRTSLAVVNQDTFLFNDTVWNNLRFVKPDATDAEIKQATQLAQAHNFIMDLPRGYETMLGDRGVRLSGGQQQRIAIARAILADPQLLILDEATSDLDSETERAIQHAIEEFGQSRTLLVIAHRLSTIRAADNIVVLEAGRVVEQGTHETLLAGEGLYQRLVQAQQLEEWPTNGHNRQVGNANPNGLEANTGAQSVYDQANSNMESKHE